MRVLLSGGGTGGHVYPLLVVAETLRGESEDTDILYVGSRDGLEASIVSRGALPIRAVDSGPIRGTTPWALAKNLLSLWRGYRQSRALIGEWRPDVVLTSGGYVSVPVAVAAWRAGVPLMVYLPDLEPGLAVRLQSWFADEIAVSFDEVLGFFPQAKTWVSGYPVRAEILRAVRRSAHEQMGLDPQRKTVLGFGGSRGARTVNQALWAILPELLLDYQVVHVTGQLDWTWVSEKRDAMTAEMQAHYRAYPYLHGPQLAAALAASDLVVSRAGAATTAEFPAVGLPCILVPYPFSGEHQQLNADFMVGHGAAVCVANADLGEQLKPTILRLLADEATLRQMSECARSLSRPAAARHLAMAVVRLAQRGVVAQ